MDRDMAQLADILVDYCGTDLEGFSTRGPNHLAQEAIKCLVFTLVNDQTAQELLARLVRDGKEELELRYREEEDH